VAGCCECGDEPSCSGTTGLELVTEVFKKDQIINVAYSVTAMHDVE
jgi:hypothetical protein